MELDHQEDVTDNEDVEVEEGSVELKATIVPKLSLAQQQNSVPVIGDLFVENSTDEELNDVELHLSSDPTFLTTKIWHIDRILAGGRFHIRDVAIDVSRKFLAEVREAIKGSVTFSLKQGEETLADLKLPIDVLAPDEWGGIGYLPEMTAAYCLPNDPAVAVLMREAASKLAGAGLNDSLEGYQSTDRKRVWELVSAVYNAVAARGIVYANPPASFEKIGQKVRFPSRVLKEELATCFDIALLFAAVLEQIGLNSLVLITKDHAFAGCWLVDEDFSLSAQDDPQAIRKRVKGGELVLVETTFLTKRQAPSLKQAANAALAHLDAEDDFHYAIDIKRSRISQIRPLNDPEQEKVELRKSPDDITVPTVALDIEEAPDLPELEYIVTKEEKPDSPEGRVERWKRRLLDLTLRNNLLNFKATKKAIPIFCHDPAELEDRLAEGDQLKFIPMPEVMEGNDPRSAVLHHERHSQDAKKALALEALRKKDLLINLPEKDMDGRLLELYRKARNDLEEGGANTLFLAIGFLNWKQEDSSERVFKAPLLLLPVSVERKSVISGFRLTLIDDDPRINPTLLQMLRQDFALTFPEFEDELPRDHAGLDVPKIWQIVRNAVRDKRGWELTEDVYISTFSFTKYLMWKDLQDRTDDLKKNPVVQHLIDTPRDIYPDQGDFPSSKELDEKQHPKDTFCPMIADSSQLAAVFAASQGKNFVLVGPPGTGKSQTITNIIVQCLAEGKTVLFVSEKMAALDVVYRRLRDVGMGDFCLELHSSKARKMDVLEQLGVAWGSTGGKKAEDWEKEADKLVKLRDKLNQFPQHLHKMYKNGLTPFQALSTVIGSSDEVKLALSWPSLDAHSIDDLDELRELLEKLGIDAREVGGVSENPFREISTGEWSRGWQTDFEAAASELKSAAISLGSEFDDLTSALKISLENRNWEAISALGDLARLLPQAFGQSYTFAATGDASNVIAEIDAVIADGQAYDRKKSTLSVEFDRSATKLDLDQLITDWDLAVASWWPKSIFAKGKVKKLLRTKTNGGAKVEDENVSTDLANLVEMRLLERQIEGRGGVLKCLGKDWQELDSNWSDLEQAKSFAKMMAGVLSRLSEGDLDKLMDLRGAISRLLGEGNDFLSPTGPIGAKASAYLASLETNQAALSKMRGLVSSDSEQDLKFEADDWTDSVKETTEDWLSHIPKLRMWCAWRKARKEAIAKDLNSVVKALEDGLVEPEGIGEAFEVNYRRWWLDQVVDADPVLRDFISAEHERSIEDFKKLDQQFMELTPKYIRAKLSGNIPSKSAMSTRGQTEWGVLNRELNKKARHMPLRKLVNSLPNVLTKLTPCLLMSPLSIAQYLGADSSLFDVVVFDEASQIPVWDAIGAVARGKQAVIVGDPKQLPPTSFFGRTDDKEDEDLEVEDLESILDECMGASLPTLYLDRHYRSRHESLITFSNHRYYQSRLVTFPSAVTDDIAVKYHHVPQGVFERSGSRSNRKEAEAVASAVVAWLKDPEFIENKWTIGVVTFNQQQQILIEDLLEQYRRNDPTIEHHFSTDQIEPVFVKNLENVQGDERDIILFSVTYAPAPNGRMYMNFGPLNKEGGERRLNVAITRARQALHVYGTLRGEDIDLSRTKAIGVRDFKHFLEFAERGSRALAEAIEAPRGDFDSPFEQEVAERLSNKGWDIHTQIGVSSYRIDLGVVHPDSHGKYLAGVECDGATYHSSANARERDRLREMVLNGLGWNIVRIWSTDWWIDPAGATEKIHSQLEALLEADRNKPEEEPELDLGLEVQEEAEELDEPEVEEEVEESANEPAFAITNLTSHACGAVGDNFHESSETRRILSMTEAIIEQEAPISLSLLAERVARAYGLSRTGAKILRRMRMAAEASGDIHKEDGVEFVWKRGEIPEDHEGYRVTHTAGEIVRNVHDIPIEELINLVRYVQETDCPLDVDELKRCIGDRLGYKRVAKKVSDRLDEAIERI